MSATQKTAWLFPGQGSQQVGMGMKLLKEFDAVNRYVQIAEDYSKQKILEPMQRGPDSLLSKTEIQQPAMVALSCGYIDLLKQGGEQPDFVAGHSLGEFSALYAADVLNAESVIKLACDRGRLMGQTNDGGMVAVKSVDLSLLESLIDSVQDAVICLANYNAPSQLVVSGEEQGLAELCEKIVDADGSFVRLNVSGAWHSPLVAVAAHEFQKIVSVLAFNAPSCQMVMGSTAEVVSDANKIRSIMINQMTRPVRWYEVIELMYENDCKQFYEVGCGKVLKGLMRRILVDTKDYKIQGIEHGPTINKLIAAAQSGTEQNAVLR